MINFLPSLLPLFGACGIGRIGLLAVLFAVCLFHFAPFDAFAQSGGRASATASKLGSQRAEMAQGKLPPEIPAVQHAPPQPHDLTFSFGPLAVPPKRKTATLSKKTADAAASGPNRAQTLRFNMPEAVYRALDVNFSIEAALSTLKASESGRKAARSEFGPVLGTSYGYSSQENRTDENLYNWRVWLRQDVFSGFATLAAYQKAALQKDSSEASLNKARLDLILQVQTNFFLYIKAEEDVRSATDSLRRLQEQLDVTRSFYEVGLRPKLEVLQAEANVSDAEDSLLRAKNTVETQRVRLNTLLNIPESTKVDYNGALDFIPFAASLDTCLEKAYRQRPDLIMARKSVEIAQKDKMTAASGYYPTVQAEGSWSTQGDTASAAGSTSMPKNYSSLGVDITASMNIFEWGRTHYTLQQASHTVNRMLAEENELKQEVIFEVQSRLLDINNAAQRIQVATKGLAQAREAYTVALARYKSQVGTFLDVLDAQAKLTAAETSLIAAKADYLTALANIYNAAGEENPTLYPR